MRKMQLVGLVTVLLALLTSGVVAVAKGPDVEQILREVDSHSTFPGNDFSAVMSMVTEDPEKGLEKHVVRVFRRDGEDKFLLLIQEPNVHKGQGYLRVDDNLWFYDPESRKFSHTSMKENFGSTDAKNSDFRRSTLANDYKVVSCTEGKLGKYQAYIMDLKAVNDEVTYPYLKLWVNKNPHIVLKAEQYSLSNRLLRVALYPSYARVGNSYVPTTMVLTDELVQGRKTQITIKDISLSKLPDSVFTKSYVERVSR